MINFRKHIITLLASFLLIPWGISQPHTTFYHNSKIKKFNNGTFIKVSCFDDLRNKKSLCDEDFRINEFIVSKYSKKGKVKWTKNICLPNYYINLIEVKGDEKQNVYLSGDFFSQNGTKLGFYIVMLNKRGKALWSKAFEISNDLKNSFTSSTFYFPEEDKFLFINRTALLQSENNYFQLDLFKFNKEGKTLIQATARVSNEIIGTSVTTTKEIYFLGSESGKKNKIDYLVSFSDALSKYSSTQTNDFQILNSSGFSVEENSRGLILSEIDIFNDIKISKNYAIKVLKNSTPVFTKCFVKQSDNMVEKPNIFGTMEASIGKNLWQNEIVKHNNLRNTGIVFHIKDTLEEVENIFSSYSKQRRKLQKLKAEIYQINNIESGIYKTISIEKKYLFEPEVIIE